MSHDAAPEPTFEEGRTIELEVEVQATPEQVWEAIATGPGISSWFVPAEVRGDHIVLDFGPGLGEDSGTITVADAPRRFRYESPQRDRVLAYEFLVEAEDGGSCTVRLVNSGFGTGEDWDDQYDGMTQGWTLFLLHLRVAVEHFAGEPVASIVATGQVPDAQATSTEEGWAALRTALAMPEVLADGELVTIGHADDGPYVVGRVQHVEDELVLVLLDGVPGRGYAYVGAEAFDGGVMVSTYLYLFGDDAQAKRDALADRWYGWMQREFALLEGDPHEPADVG
jgi:uncharacterized protein YndB with AHSA1/START domain